ncbi:E3 ubiquitin-protein ligase RNF167-like [Notechis scutatus]|uniref:E3 ubiquitin-protein ligase RNF167-like n=1 Tax=Notechis scutatus TaxID=8663 RepID=A0A6J1VUX2_9SAUR|nr:E3 ubiquitin-protein ligase RNF167-like [Notechis scutatus]
MWGLVESLPLLVTISLFLETALAKPFVHLVYKQNDTCMDFNAAPAWFGPPVPVTGLKGYLLETVPANACHPIKAAPVSNRTPSGFVALIRLYDCSFNLKVFHAQEAGYRAAIIYNLCSDFLVNMAISMEERRLPIVIPSMFIGRTASKLLRRQVHSAKDAQIMVVVPQSYYNSCLDETYAALWELVVYDLPIWPGYCTQQLFLKILKEFGLLISLSMGISFLVLVSWAKWGRSNQGIRVKTFKHGDRYDTCVICMAEYEAGDRLKVLPCAHIFHATCINTWLLIQPVADKTCPICKQKVHSAI